MALKNAVFKGDFTASGTAYFGETYSNVSQVIRGVVTATLSIDETGEVLGTWVFTGTTTFVGVDNKTHTEVTFVEPDYETGAAKGTTGMIQFFDSDHDLVGEASLTSDSRLSGVVFNPAGSEDHFSGELFLVAEDAGTDAGPDDDLDTIGGDGEDTIEGGTGNDTLTGGAGDDKLFGGAGDDSIEGGAGDDNLFGGTGKDHISGGDGDDVLDGGTGADYIAGGAGSDTYYVDNKKDVVFEASNTPSGTSGLKLGIDLGSTIDTVISSVKYTLGNYVENLTLASGTAKLAGTGNDLDNVITGNSASNKLSGSGGADTLDGGEGADKMTGGGGADVFVFSNLAAGGVDTVSDFTDEDVLSFDTRVFEQLAGATADNLVLGTKAADTDDYLIYNTKAKALYYDADGAETDFAAVRIAVIKGPDAKSITFEDMAFT